MRHIYTSIDLGSDTIKIVVCELYQNKLNLLAATSFASLGIRNGLITDPEAARKSLEKAKKEVESMLGFEIKEVIATVPSNHANFSAVSGRVEIDEFVDSEDVSKVLDVASSSKLKNGYEMVTLIPIDFSIDGVTHVKDPKEMEAKSLEVRAIMISVPKKNIYSVVGLLESLSLEVVDIMIDSVSDMSTYKTKENSSQVGAIINIGSETTNISIYNKSIVIKNSIIGMGGKNIDQDIAYVYKLHPNDALKIKEEFAYASSKYTSRNGFYEVEDKFHEIRKISQREVSELVQSILEEILVLARKEINLLTKQPVDYIIITGGTSSESGFLSLAEELLGPIATVGNIKIPGIRNNKYATALGSIVYFINKLKLKGIDYTMVTPEMEKEGEASSLTMLGKVFGYFFNE